jgi:hypothetical protein
VRGRARGPETETGLVRRERVPREGRCRLCTVAHCVEYVVEVDERRDGKRGGRPFGWGFSDRQGAVVARGRLLRSAAQPWGAQPAGEKERRRGNQATGSPKLAER